MNVETVGTVPAKKAIARPAYHRKLRWKSDWTLSFVLSILGLLTFVPVLMLIELSFKDDQQMAIQMWLPTLPLHTLNYVKAFNVMGSYMINSVVFVLGTVTIAIICSTLTAYALARYPFPGREFFYIAVLSLLMIPGILTLITCFIVTLRLKLNNTLFGVWLPLAAGAQAFQIIVLRTFFASLPQELFEAGRLDGASEGRMLLSIAIPLATPILTTLIVLQAMGTWNEFIWPIMVLSRPERYPAVLAILRLSTLITARDIGAMYAGYVIVGLPMLLMFAVSSRAFIRGLTSGAIKM